MTHQILLSGFSLNDLLDKIELVVEKKLSQLVPNEQLKNSCSKFISRNEVAQLLKISLPTLHEYTNYGFLQSYKIGKRVLYKHNEVLASVEKLATYKFKKGGNHGA